MSDLKSLSGIFEHRLIRIPDYQRGYAWQDHELNDFWEDLFHLVDNKVHYTGVITLEPVDQSIYKRWDNDLWLIEDRGHKPFYVVDGQQRLTTAIILIQTIMEVVGNDAELNSQTIEEIRRQYVMVKGAKGLQRSFLFGYEKDNPSDEFLRTSIFMEHSATNHHEQTLYTRNLAYAKTFFAKKLRALEPEDIAKIFKKLTLKFKFNLYEIDAEIDVFVTFETMNNRGKQLSSLELLKNRLIYLSTLFPENKGHEVLRSKINESWKTIYEYLGKNPDAPLSDEYFLRNHWRMYFTYSGRKDNDYKVFLLDKKFTAQNVTHPANEEQRVTIEEVEKYVTNLQKAIKHWFYMHNPYYMPLAGYDNDKDKTIIENKTLLDQLGRLSFGSFKPLILAAYCSDKPFSEINELLAAAERCSFTLFTLSQRRSHTGESEFFRLARLLLRGDIYIDNVVGNINGRVTEHYSAVDFGRHIEKLYRDDRDGFYHWVGLRYFLYEHENYLRQRGKQSTEKMDWKKLNAAKKNHVTVEHIYPQTKTGDWADAFSGYSKKEKRFLTHSLGNLLPLSRAKNSSLQNDSFDLKKNKGNGVGYYNGSVSENELAQQYDKWTSEGILKRGLELLEFMEERWDIKLVDEDFKKEKILCLGFL